MLGNNKKWIRSPAVSAFRQAEAPKPNLKSPL